MSGRRIAILGAGPAGLEAALAASDAGVSFTVFEAGETAGASVRAWGHVRLFTPWSMNASPRARARLAAAGLFVPDGQECPTGTELADQLLVPIAGLPDIAPHVGYGNRVLEVGRDGLLKSDEIGTGARAARPFRIVLRDGAGTETAVFADVVLDCTGTYGNPNALGTGGIGAPGERGLSAHIIRQLPDFDTLERRAQESEWSGARILLVGAGHSAQTAARDLAGLVRRSPDTTVTWVIRSHDPSFGAIEDDPLPARASLVESARSLGLDEDTPLDVRIGCAVEALSASTEGIQVTLRDTRGDMSRVTVDRILALTGSVGDARIYRQLQVHECYATSGPMKLAAALLASSSSDCLTQTSHGVDTLRNPEPDFFILGEKSYGRNANYLMKVGWEQVDEVFSLLGAVSAPASR